MVDRISEQYSQPSDPVENECFPQSTGILQHMYLMGPISFDISSSEAVSGNMTRCRNSRSDLHGDRMLIPYSIRQMNLKHNPTWNYPEQVDRSLKINDLQGSFVFYRLTLISLCYRKNENT